MSRKGSGHGGLGVLSVPALACLSGPCVCASGTSGYSCSCRGPPGQRWADGTLRRGGGSKPRHLGAHGEPDAWPEGGHCALLALAVWWDFLLGNQRKSETPFSSDDRQCGCLPVPVHGSSISMRVEWSASGMCPGPWTWGPFRPEMKKRWEVSSMLTAGC